MHADAYAHRRFYTQTLFPGSVWAQGSSNSGGLYLIFTPSHLHTFSHTFSSSHLLIFTSAHLHICSSSHLLIFASAHLHICSSSHLLLFTSSHLHIFSSSHLLLFTSSYLHIFSSSHLLIFTSAYFHICSSSHLHIFTYSHSHLHILTSSLSLTLSPLSSLLSLSPFSLPFLSLAFFIFLSLGRGWCRRGVTKREPFRTKWGSIVKNWSKIAILHVPEQPFRTKWGSIVKNWGKIAILLVPDLSWSNPFARNEGRSSKTEVKLRFYLCRTCPGATLSHEMKVDRQKRGKIAILLVPDLSWSNPFARNEGRSSKTEVKLRFYLCRTCPGATLSHEMKVDRQKLR